MLDQKFDYLLCRNRLFSYARTQNQLWIVPINFPLQRQPTAETIDCFSLSVNLSYYNTTRSNAQRSVYKSFEHLLRQQSPNRAVWVSPFLPFYRACNKATQCLFLVSENMTHCCQSSPFSHLLKPLAVNHTPHSAAVLMSTFSKTI